jgi:hypothetical protein
MVLYDEMVSESLKGTSVGFGWKRRGGQAWLRACREW